MLLQPLHITQFRQAALFLGCVPQLPWYGLFADWKLYDFVLNLFEMLKVPVSNYYRNKNKC